jgi:hypothetical protein
VTVNEATAVNGGTVYDPNGDVVALFPSVGMATQPEALIWAWNYTRRWSNDNQTVTVLA